VERCGFFGLFAAASLAVLAVPAQVSAAGTAMECASLDQSQSYKLHGILYLPEDGSTASRRSSSFTAPWESTRATSSIGKRF